MVQTMAAVYPEFAFIGKGLIKNIPVPVIIMIVICIICQIFLSKSKIGRIIYSIGSNPNASKFSGINVDFYKIIRAQNPNKPFAKDPRTGQNDRLILNHVYRIAVGE